MNNSYLYYQFLALNNQLVVLDYAQQSELFAIIEDETEKGKYKVRQYVFIGQFVDSDETWYILDFSDESGTHRVYVQKNKMEWYRTEGEAKLRLWEKMANGAGE